MVFLEKLKEKFHSWKISWGYADGRRICCGCGESEVLVGPLVDCPCMLNKRQFRYRKDGAVETTFSRYSLVVPRLCIGCHRHLEKLRSSIVSLEVRIRLKQGEDTASVLIVEEHTGVSLRALAIPELSLIPPLPDGIPVGSGP